MSFWGKIKGKSLALRETNEREVVVAVPEIKEYLVREYERVNDLKLINEGLEQQLEKSRETELKYDATLVTLDEYSKRLQRAEMEIQDWKARTERARQDLRAAKDEVNSYKIKFNNAAITKAELEKEIVEEVKAAIISIINGHKGVLSKKTACEIISAYEKMQRNVPDTNIGNKTDGKGE